MEGRAPSPPETWDAFFSDFFLRAYADQERQGEAQALAAARLAGCPGGGDLLDVPCGFGRHSVALARANYRVVGVDRSESLLAEAERRAGGERWPKLVRADYRELPLADESFDAAGGLGPGRTSLTRAVVGGAAGAAGCLRGRVRLALDDVSRNPAT